ncbi:MAG: HEAT repeat domain-containing protein [Acidobacteriota bacterium]|nr:HEAT repeat domain-containing protein [Acidobacteriota bacterium]
MNCPDVQQKLSLYLYGELDFASEEQVENHLAECAFCQLAFSREKTWHTAASSEQRDVSLDLLSQCRQDLRNAIKTQVTETKAQTLRQWHWPAFLRVSPTRWSYQLAVASSLVFFGFIGGRFLDRFGPVPSGTTINAGLGPFTHIRDVQPAGQHRVRILMDQINQREVIGDRDDQDVKRWLLVGVQDSPDPGIRVDSVEMLNGQSGIDVREALLGRIQHDPNAAVRLKALQSVSRFADDPTVQSIVRSVLEQDEDPAVRSAAIDVLVAQNGAAQISPELSNTLQMLARSEHDEYIRGRCLELLHAINNPTGVY